MKFYKQIPLCGLLLTCSVFANQSTIVVSPDGPIATLEAARQKVRELKQQQPNSEVEVLIKGGVYPLRETVVFNPEDSGKHDAPIVYKAFPGETPVFTGGIKIDQWEKVGKDPAGTPKEAQGKLWVAKIPKVAGKNWVIKSLYDGDHLLQRAKAGDLFFPERERENDFNMQGKKVWRDLPYDEGGLVKSFERHVYFQGNDIRDWDNLEDVEIKLTERRWISNVVPLERVVSEKKIGYMAADPTYQPQSHDRPYWIEGAVDYLDEPGEWIVNSKQGLIYMWPEKNPSEMDVVAPFLQEFIRVEGQENGPFAEHIHFEGLTFIHGQRDTLLESDKGLQHDWEMYDKGNAVVRFRHAEDCKFNSNVIRNSSGTGIRLDLHCQRIEAASNRLNYLGGCGIVLSGYGPGTKDVNKDNIIHDNYIHHIGEFLFHSSAIFIAQSGNNKVTHNTIRDVPYNGITISGCRPHEFYLVTRMPFRRAWLSTIRAEECKPYTDKAWAAEKGKTDIRHFLPLLHARDNLIGMNDISKTLQKLGDGNAIYLSAMGSNNRLERNFLHDNYHTAGTIRLDDNPSYTIIKENVITEADRGIGIKGPCELENNFVFTDMFLRGDVKMNASLRNGTKSERNIFFPPAKSKEKNGYFLYGDGKKDVPYHSKLPRTENSLYFSLNKAKPFVPATGVGTDLFTGKNVTPGADAVKLLYADPQFDEGALKQRIFRFKPGSPAEKLGIQPIDLSEVGSSLATK